MLFLRNCRRAHTAADRCSSCEVRYKPVGFSHSDGRNPTEVPWGAVITTIVRRTQLESRAMGLADPPTNIDPQGRTSWDIDDAVVRLRLWGTEYAHALPEPRVALKLGSGPSCDVQLHDDAGRLSREH